jgi:acetyl-CoA synthetase
MNICSLQKQSLQPAYEGRLTEKRYKDLYKWSIKDPITFWQEHAKVVEWIRPFTKVKNVSFQDPVHIAWFEDGILNACYNCVDRHLKDKANKIAYYFEPDMPGEGQIVTYAELHKQVCKLANVLKNLGVQKGDRVCLYLPMIPYAVYAMLACARIGAIHSVVFGGFSAQSLAGRIDDSEAKIVITADEGMRGGKTIPLKATVDEALSMLTKNTVEKVCVVGHTKSFIPWTDKDIDLKQAMHEASSQCAIEPMNAEDPLFILYTSGSTGQRSLLKPYLIISLMIFFGARRMLAGLQGTVIVFMVL